MLVYSNGQQNEIVFNRLGCILVNGHEEGMWKNVGKAQNEGFLFSNPDDVRKGSCVREVMMNMKDLLLASPHFKKI